jgi:integrase
MRVYKRPGSPFYWYEFQCAGQQFRRSSGKTSKREAEAVGRTAQDKAKETAKVKQVIQTSTPSLRLDDAALRYWSEVEDKLASASDAHRDLIRLVQHLGEATLLTEINDDSVAGLVRWRSSHRTVPHNAPKDKKPEDYPFVSAATVNHTTIRLQALYTHAKENWKDGAGKYLKFPDEPTWKKHLLPVVKKPARVIEETERVRHDAAVRDDYRPFIEFALASSRRFEFCYSLTWPEVDKNPGVITKTGKRKPDGSQKDETLPITPRIRAILEPLRGHHPKYVFTYIARRNVDGWVKGKTYINKETGEPFVAPWDQRPIKRGQRYHLVYNGAKTAYRRAMKEAGLKIGFHSLRRTRANEVYKATGDVRAVQKMMAHSKVSTTERYLAENVEHVRAAMEKADARHEVRTEGPHSDGSKVA